MSITDYLFDSVLVLLVLRQIRESRLDKKAVLLPLAIIAIVVQNYLHTIPTTGNDLLLIIGFTTIGAILGTVSALATRVRSDGGKYALVKAGWVAAAMWVLGMGFRFGFSIWANNGGASALIRFSASHSITTASAWTAALILMALAEVVLRTGILWVRAQRALHEQPAKQLSLA